jgi:co-chaperonin GroES (HSP10)
MMNNLRAGENTTVRRLLMSTLVLMIGLAFQSFAQTPSPSPAAQIVSLVGEVKAIDANAKQIVLRADSGVISTVNLSEKTQYKRLAPGETTLAKATDITLADVGAGDRVLARWRAGADIKSAPTPQVVVMNKADLAKKQEQDRAQWRRRGVSGIVSSVNPSTQEITVSSRSLMGAPQAVIIPINDKVLIRRYPPDTIPKYSEAKPSKFEEVKVGDQLRALGDKSADGTHLTAEEVLFGTFKIVGGTVTALDAANNQIKINDLQTKKPLTINLKPDSVLRRLPENAAMMFGGGMGPGGPGGAGPGGAGQKPAGVGPGGGNGTGEGGAGQKPAGVGPGGQGGGGRMSGGRSMADILESLPTISINDLKIGDTILMSSLQGSDPSQLTAISVVSGVEPLLQMMAMRQQAGGGARPQGGVDLGGSFGGLFGGIGGP